MRLERANLASVMELWPENQYAIPNEFNQPANTYQSEQQCPVQQVSSFKRICVLENILIQPANGTESEKDNTENFIKSML